MFETRPSSLTSHLYWLFTGLAALITAVGGLLYAFADTGLMQSFFGEPGAERGAVVEQRDAQAVVGWTRIARLKHGIYKDLKIALTDGSPTVGGTYGAIAQFPVFRNRPLRREDRRRMTPVAMVHRGDSVKLIDLYLKSTGRRSVPVWAKVRVNRSTRQEMQTGG